MLVMPYFHYCDTLLTDLNLNLTQRLQRVHNACIRFICNIRWTDHVTPSFELLSWSRLKQQRLLHSLCLLFQILHRPTSSPEYLASRFHYLSATPNLSTRSQHNSLLIIPSHRATLFSLSFTVNMAHIWNSRPRDIRTCRTLYTFKNKLRRHLALN